MTADAPAVPAAVPAVPPTKADCVHQVFSWVLAGASEHDILQAIATAWPGVKARPLIVAAIQRLRDSASIDRDVALGFTVEATRDLYRRMVEIGDFAGALRAVRQLADLAHRYGIAQTEKADDQAPTCLNAAGPPPAGP